MSKSSKRFENTPGINFLYREVWFLKSIVLISDYEMRPLRCWIGRRGEDSKCLISSQPNCIGNGNCFFGFENVMAPNNVSAVGNSDGDT